MIIVNGVLVKVNNEDIVNGTFVIPEGVTAIGWAAFSGCSHLTKITIPEGVIDIGGSAFFGCSNLTEIIIPKGVTRIGRFAFSGCSNLTKITIPEGVKDIGGSAFFKCSNLTEITIPKGVTYIGDEAFSKCSNLTKITILEGVTQIGPWTFEGCSNLTEITIPKGVTYIGEMAFSGCSNLTEIIIPEGVTDIGESAFARCRNLRKIAIPEGVTHIREMAFFECSNLTEITIPEGVTMVGRWAFSDCSNLTKITMPEEIKEIQSGIFNGCDNLKKISIFPEVSKAAIEALYNQINDNKCAELVLFQDNMARIEKIKSKSNFRFYTYYNENRLNIFLYRMMNSIGIDEIERMIELPNLTEEEVKRYSLEKEGAFQKLYDTKYEIDGDLGITLKLLKALNLRQYRKRIEGAPEEKNDEEIRLFKRINEKLENGFNGTLTDLLREIGLDSIIIENAQKIENSINKSLIREHLKKYNAKIEEYLTMTSDEHPEAIVSRQIEPIKTMIEDVITHLFQETGKLDLEILKERLNQKIGRAGAPYIRQRKDQIVSNIMAMFEDESYKKEMSFSCMDALRNTKEKIGGAWKRKLNKALEKIGYSFDSIPNVFSMEEIEILREQLRDMPIETKQLSIPKKGIDRKTAYKLLAKKNLSRLVTYNQLESMFGPVQEPYSEEFRKYYKLHREEFLENPEYYQYFGRIHNNFDLIINSPQLKNLYKSGKLEIEDILGYMSSRAFENQRPGDEELAKYASSVGKIVKDEDFAFIQKIFDITKKRERLSVPKLDVTGKRFRGRMLDPDDVLNLFAGDITTCCQKFGDVGEGSVLLGSIEENAGIFVVEELDEDGNVINIVGQSLTIRQKGKDGNYDRLTFDNIEIDNEVKKQLSIEDQTEILEIYKQAGKQAIERDKKFLQRLVKLGRITEEQYDSLVLKEVIAGTGYNDLEGLADLPRAEMVAPDEARYKYKTMSGGIILPWIDSAGEKVPNGSGESGIPVVITTMEEEELEEIRNRNRNGYKGKIKPKDVPLWYGKVGRVGTFSEDNIISEVIEKIKQIERTVFRENQQCLNNNRIVDMEGIEYTYNLENAKIKLGSNEDWYVVYGEQNGDLIISDLALVGGKNSQKNEYFPNNNPKLAIAEAANELYGIILEAYNNKKRILCNATSDTSLINIKRMLKKGLIEIRDLEGRKIQYQGKKLVYEDGTEVETRGWDWDNDSEIQMMDLEILPNEEKMKTEKEKTEKWIQRLSEAKTMIGVEKEEGLDELRRTIRRVPDNDEK